MTTDNAASPQAPGAAQAPALAPDEWPAVPEGIPGEPEAIFVVGVARSGTTLMRNLLERSERIAIARENHFVGHLFGFGGARHYMRKAGDLADDDAIRRIADMIYTDRSRGLSRWREVSIFWHWLDANVAHDDLERRLLAAERTERGLMAAFMRTYADKMGRPIMGEKTPAHLAYVDTLLEWFPNARVVHMMRDPRAVYVSDVRRRRTKPRRPFSWIDKVPGLLPALVLLQVTLSWRDAARRHLALEQRYPDQYMLVKFEDVVGNPDEALPRVFDFLDVALPVDPTNVNVYARGYNVGQHGIDSGAVDRWRTRIGRPARAWLGFMLRSKMRRLGYV